jgi:hypothetical protein
MIETHPKLECPADDAVLWRFMDFAKFVALLETNKLPFVRLDKMEDKYEGALTKPIIERSIELIRYHFKADDAGLMTAADSLNTSLRTDTQSMRKTVCVSCWHVNSHESAAMWKLYLKSDEGIAIRTTFADMKRAFAETPDVVYPALVKYIDYQKETYPLDNGLFSVVHKRKSFEHECEMRLIWWALASANADVTSKENQRRYEQEYSHPIRAIPSKMECLIKQIYVSPTSADWFGDLVRDVAKRYSLPCAVVKSDLYADPLW